MAHDIHRLYDGGQRFSSISTNTTCRVKNRFRIGPAGAEDSSSKVTVKAWEAAQMPAASQDRIAASVTITDTDLASLSMEAPDELTFMVDRDLAYTESDEIDNVVTSTMTLHSRWLGCPLFPVAFPDAWTLDEATIYWLDGGPDTTAGN